MNYRVWTRYEECMLKVKVETSKNVRVRLIVSDYDQKYTEFSNRFMTVNGKQDFIVRMPLSPNTTLVSVYNELIGNKQKGQDDSVKIVEITKHPLEKRMDLIDFENSDISNFVNFAQRFAFNAGVLPCKTYKNGSGKFVIDYLPYMKSKKTGNKLSTPARIGVSTGKMEVSKESFMQMTVPMRMAILLHEFSHYYLNSDIKNETEADLNGLLIYLSLGYPRIEAYEAFLETFIGTPTEQNKKRYDIINNFILNFEKANVVIE